MHNLFSRRIAVSAVALFLVGVAGAGANTNSLLAWYTMEDANPAQLTDYSGNSRHAIFYPTSANHGYSNDAAMGAQSYEKKIPLIWQGIPTVSPTSGALSVCMWYKRIAAPSDFEILWAIGTKPSDHTWFMVSQWGPNDEQIVVEYQTNGVKNYTYSSNGCINSTVWNHLALVMNLPAGRLDLYLNGRYVVAGNRDIGTNVLMTMGGHLGITPGGDYYSYDARFDDVRFYDGALTQAEIRGICGIPPATAYDAWTEGLVPDPWQRNPTNDPDHDGFGNLWEYSQGSDPMDSYSNSVLDMAASTEGPRVLFRRVTSATDIVYRVEQVITYDTPLQWGGAATNQNGAWLGPVTETPLSGNINQVSFAPETNARFGFFRVQITR